MLSKNNKTASKKIKQSSLSLAQDILLLEANEVSALAHRLDEHFLKSSVHDFTMYRSRSCKRHG